MKIAYETPDLEVIRFLTEDVITASYEGGLDDNETDLDVANVVPRT